MQRSSLLMVLGVRLQLIGFGACDAPAHQAEENQKSDAPLPLSLANDKHGEDQLGRMLDSLLKDKAEPECFYGRYWLPNGSHEFRPIHRSKRTPIHPG